MGTVLTRGVTLDAALLAAAAGGCSTGDPGVQAVQRMTAVTNLKWRIANDDSDHSIGGPIGNMWMVTVPSDMVPEDLAESASDLVLNDQSDSYDSTQTHLLVMTSPAKAERLGRSTGWAYCHEFVLFGGTRALEAPWPDGTTRGRRSRRWSPSAGPPRARTRPTRRHQPR